MAQCKTVVSPVHNGNLGLKALDASQYVIGLSDAIWHYSAIVSWSLVDGFFFFLPVVRGQKRRHGNVLASSKEGLRQTALDQWLTGSPSSRLNGNPSGRHHEGIPPRHIQDSPLSSSRPQTGRGEVQQGFRAGQTATAVVIDLTEDQPRQKTPVNSSRCKQGHEDVVDLTQTSDGGIGPGGLETVWFFYFSLTLVVNLLGAT